MKQLKFIKVAKALYYIMVFGWLLQIAVEGYTYNLILPTIVVIVYGLWLRYFVAKQNKNK